MQIISDTISFIKTLSFVDIVFFFAVVALMLLIVTLIHFVLENKYNEETGEKESTLETKNSPIIAITKNGESKIENKQIEDQEIMKEANDLLEIAAALEQAEPNNSNLNRYEEEQEEKAIISYDELLERTNEWAINYSEEESIAEDLTVKKVDLNNLVNKEISLKPEIKVSVISYEKEEAFLAALKELQHLLN